MAREVQLQRHRSTEGSTSLITGALSCPGISSDHQQMHHGFESGYSLFNAHHGPVPLRDPCGVGATGWKAIFARPSGDLQCSSSPTSPKGPMASDASADFYQPGGGFSEMAAGQGELLMVAPEAAAWNTGRLVVDDSSLRCLLPGSGVGQPRQALSLSLCNTKPSDMSLPQQQQQSFNLIEGIGRRSLTNLRSGLVAKTTTDAHVQPQQQALLQEGQFFPQLVMASPSSRGLSSQPPLHLMSSKYLVPIQELLYEFCSLGAGSTGEGLKKKPHSQWEEGASSSSAQWNQSLLSLDILDLKKRMAKLVSMLEEVDRRYRRYCEQMRAVVSSFEAVAGEGAAAAYSTLASKAMSRHFRCLRDGIVGQIRATKKALGEKDPAAPGTTRGETPRLRLLDRYIRQQKAFQQAGMMETHPWRPQRGLPERSVSVLRAWLFEHFLHPYPSDVDKHILARQTGLSRSQVCNWFINARVRLWKPMVEEMYLEEGRELDNQSGQVNVGREDGRLPGQSQNPNPSDNPQLLLSDDQKPRPAAQLGGGSEADDSLSSVVNSSHNSERAGDATGGKDPRYPNPRPYHPQLQQLARAANSNFGVVDMDFSSYNECGSGQQSFGRAGAVSLTLGLQQHNGAGMSLSFPSASQSTLFFSKEPMDGYQPVQFSILDADAQNPPYRNLMGPQQLLHDLSG